MYHNIHTEFIQTPIKDILIDGLNASRGVGNGIETQTLSDYIFTSLFLKMTGAQEQKCKCICWEIATNDYEFRYDYLQEKGSFGEFSNYDSKSKLYKILIKYISKNTEKPFTIKNQEELIKKTVTSVDNILNKSILCCWAQKDYIFFMDGIYGRLKKELICPNEKNLFKTQNDYDHPNNILVKDYTSIVWLHRNRCAHNTTSYQRNLPKFDTLIQADYQWHNYFYRFSLLILIDNIFMTLYDEYLNSLS